MVDSPEARPPFRRPPFPQEPETFEEFLRFCCMLDEIHWDIGPLRMEKPPPASVIGWWTIIAHGVERKQYIGYD